MSHHRPRLRLLAGTLWIASSFLLQTVHGHEHHTDMIAEGEGVSPDPIDGILWAHILLQALAWGILFPTGMVLGIIKSRWHVPLQTLASAIAVAAYFLGHAHKGRQFAENAHSKVGNWVMIVLIVQIGLGLYLKLHLNWKFFGTSRKYLVMAHGINGKALPVIAWVQMLFGGIASQGFCRGDHVGQCLAHFIMGSAFIAYGIILTILLLVGQVWLRKTGRSQEFFDSLIIALWGCVNTFTEHRWGTAWVHNDLQHTTMGIIWWCAGLLGMWLSRTRDGRPKRNIVPSLVILLTGWAMSSHPQNLMISAKTHSAFGYTLMAAGLTRIIEISFLLKDAGTQDESGSNPGSFQHLPPFLLYASGFLFMGATEEQMQILDSAGVDHVSYILILYSIAFLLYLFVNMLLYLYAVNEMPAQPKPDPERANGHLGVNGSTNAQNQRLRDAEEFELHGLGSDSEDEGDESQRLMKEERRSGSDS